MADYKNEISDEELLAEIRKENPNAVVPSLGTEPLQAPPIQEDASDEELLAEIEQERQYGDQGLKAGALGLGSAASFGLLEQGLVRSGLVKPETLEKIEEYNPEEYLTGEVGGVVGPAVLTGGTSLGAKVAAKTALAPARAVTKAASIAEKMVQEELAKKGAKGLAAKITQKALSEGAGSAVEGAAYGAGRLLKEDALGKADFNAENLMSSVGTGALTGAALGGSFGALKPLVGKASKSGQEVFSGINKKIFDDGDAAKKLTGLTQKEVMKLEAKHGPNFGSDLAEFYRRNGLKATSSADDIEQIVVNTKKSAGKEISDIIADLERKAGPESAALPTNYEVFSNAANSAKKLADDYRNIPGFETHVTRLENYSDAWNKLGQKPGTIGVADLNALRKKTGELRFELLKNKESDLATKAAGDVYSIFRKTIDNIAERIDPNIAEKLKFANKEFSLATDIEKAVTRKAIKSQDLFKMSDLLIGGIGYNVANLPGLAVAGIRALTKSDLAKRVAILSKMERINSTIDMKIKGAISSFAEKTGKVAKRSILYKLAQSPLAKSEETGETTKNKEQAYNMIRDNVVALQNNPEELLRRVTKSTYVLGAVAPETSAALGTNIIKAIDFLSKKVPRDARGPSSLGIGKKEYKPSSIELAKFERYMQVIDNPASVLEELKSNTLTREHIEALKEVYPNMYSRIRSEILNQIDDNSKMPYSKKVQLSILLDIPLDDSMTPENIMALQSNFQPEEPEQDTAVNSTVTGISGIKKANRMATETQKLEYGEG